MTEILRDVRFPLDGNGDRFIACRMSYSLGGPNVWTGKNTPRGYWLSVTPIKVEHRFCMVAPMDGIKMLLKGVPRASRKAEDEASKLMDAELDGLVARVCEKNGIALSDLGRRIEM